MPMSIMVLRVRYGLDGSFYVNTETKKLERVDVANKRNLETNFPGAAEPDYSYKKLETLMKYYMSTRDGKMSTMSLKEILETIQRKGFFFQTKPSLRLSVQTIEE